MQQILNTLYVMTPQSYVRLENDTLRVEVEHETKLRVPLHHIGALVCFGEVLVSPAVFHRCGEDGIALVLLDRNGRFKARVEGPVSGNILLRQAQHRRAADPAFVLETARACIAGKLKNCRQIMTRGARETDSVPDKESLARIAESLAHSLQSLRDAPDLETLRGIEGEAAKTYFSGIQCLLREEMRADFAMQGRTRRPPKDRFNAIISFLYSMLANDCRSALESVGLDPQLGFLHSIRPGRPALALDLMEEFRPILADRLAITLVNRGQIRAEDFIEREGGAVEFQDEPRKAIVIAYQERKKDMITHPLIDAQIHMGLAPMLQARFFARAIRGELDGYLPFTVR